MRILLYCRRASDLEALQQEGNLLYAYAVGKGYTVQSTILELDAGNSLERPGFYELLRQLQHGYAEGILITDLQAFSQDLNLQQQACQRLRNHKLLLALR